MFTIEIEKKDRNDEFTFSDIKKFHKECLGGRIEEHCDTENAFIWKGKWICQRCEASIKIKLNPSIKKAIIRLAVGNGENVILGKDVIIIRKD